MSTSINSVGLILDVIGVILIWRFGLPPSVDKTGQIHITAAGVDKEEIKKGKNYDRISRIGLMLLILGFGLQIVSNYVN